MASAAARRYARAVFELAQEEGQEEPWTESLRQLSAVLADPEIRSILDNPSIDSRRRQQAVDEMAGGKLLPEAVNLVRLLVEGRRVGAMRDILEEYERLLDRAAGRVRATATTAVELSASDRDKIAHDLSGRLGKEVRLEVEVDPKIIGGMILQVGDSVVDASLGARLQQLRRRLTTA